MEKPIIVSACLLGYNCKYNGKNNQNEKIINYLKDKDYLAVCPEQLGNLPTPRKKSELNHCTSKDVFLKEGKVINEDYEDVSENFINGALKAFDYAIKYQVQEAILKEKSPSCGFRCIYNGDFNSTLVNGEGLFAYLLKKHNVKILTEEDFREEKKNETN